MYVNRTLGKLAPKKKKGNEPGGTSKGRGDGVSSVAPGRRPWYKIARSMPEVGDIFVGELGDVRSEEGAGRNERDITFYKREIQWRRRFNYPTAGDQIVLIDSSGDRYELKFSKPETADGVCLGPAENLKAWYQRQGFWDGEAARPVSRDGCRNKVYFVYTGAVP